MRQGSGTGVSLRILFDVNDISKEINENENELKLENIL